MCNYSIFAAIKETGNISHFYRQDLYSRLNKIRLSVIEHWLLLALLCAGYSYFLLNQNEIAWYVFNFTKHVPYFNFKIADLRCSVFSQTNPELNEAGVGVSTCFSSVHED